MNVKGTVILVSEVKQVSEKFKTRDLILRTHDQYPQDVSIQFNQDKCELIDNLVAGQVVDVTFNLLGREWKSLTGEVKYFNTLNGWKIEVLTNF